MKGEVEVYIPLTFGTLLVALALSPIENPYAALLEWGGAFLVFAALSYVLDAKFTAALNVAAFAAGSLGDSWLLGVNPLGWILTNYMLFIHSSLGALIGILLRDNQGR